MSTPQCVAHCQGFCDRWSWWKGRILHQKSYPKFNNQGKTVGLLLRVLEPIFGKGMVVILDSGFCVLKGIVELKKRGVYASALIKKRRYWPKYIKGNVIKQHFDEKAVGNCDSWKGNMDEVPFHVYTMKEPDYVMSLMLTYGTNLRSGKETCCEWVDSDGTKKQQNPTILKWWEITSYTDTQSTTTTINVTHLLAWRLFGA